MSPPLPPSPPSGPPIFDELFAPEADGAGAARAGADEDLGLVEEMHARAG